MKTLLLSLLATTSIASAAAAADLIPPGAPAPEPVFEDTIYSWTGPYAGIFGGVTTGDYDYTGAVGGNLFDLSVSGSGFLAGGQIGYDYQFNSFVAGAVADIAWANHEAEVSATIPGFGSANAESRLKYLGTVRARIGYALDRFLAYGHGGFAYGKTEQSVSATGFGTLETDSGHRFGWTIGAGAEYAITDNISFQTQYAYTDLGEETIFNNGVIAVDEDVSFHAVRAGLNFRF